MRKMCRHNSASGYALLLLTIFLTYLCSNFFFNHYHLYNGEVVAHSHIYAGSPDKPEHNHSEQELELISEWSNYSALETAPSQVTPSQQPLLYTITLQQEHPTESLHHLHLSLRAPPVMVK